MTDVRLTAVNPEDSQVYPVACNDKGELLLDSGGATGDLDVTGNLTVAGTGTFSGPLKTRQDSNSALAFAVTQNGTANADATIRFDGNGAGTFAGNIQVGGNPNNGGADGLKLDSTGVYNVSRPEDSNLFLAYQTGSSNPKIRMRADGSVSFQGNVTLGAFDLSSTTVSGIQLRPGGELLMQRPSTEGTSSLIDGRLGNTQKVNIRADGSATFARGLQAFGITGAVSTSSQSAFTGMQEGAVTSEIFGDGSAIFTGNVTAPNINFKLAPTTVAAMPAPLIDEGFAANNEVDLLSVIMEMKLQIRDLNAFMQRSTQDDPET